MGEIILHLNWTKIICNLLISACFHRACERNDLYSNGWKNQKKNILWHMKITWNSDVNKSINKVLLGHSWMHLFMHCLWLCSQNEYHWLPQRPNKLQSLKYLLSGTLQKCVGFRPRISCKSTGGLLNNVPVGYWKHTRNLFLPYI